MNSNTYLNQARLMLRILPYVASENCFALKGGTAINFFVREMPRISIDIDLTYLHLERWEDSLKNIGEALHRIANEIKEKMHCTIQLVKKQEKGVEFINKVVVKSGEGIVKIEPNIVFRGSVFPPEKRSLVKTAQDKFELSVTSNILSVPELYAGKLCAALDRQHPRDLFDVMILLKHEGITEEILKAFVIYLAGHDRPIHELLDPNSKDIRKEYESSFRGMTEMVLSCENLMKCQRKLPGLIRDKLSNSEKEFLLSVNEGEPRWNLIDAQGIESLPALRWKCQNIQKMEKEKRKKQLGKLKAALEKR
ncbi:MAG: nucleotidyl transferase AbiEii/AbiGii toxin family protein [Deltaproteobacteria bacterium]|nr:nucleotidyl transferase AbiEii/AbiGii toxin family protein [Deltaproteobacteria bacterium]